jgi:hypothetical protein
MFGYVLPEKPELKVKEYELFRAYYCGICKSIGKRYGQLPRIVLNYDCTFLAVLLSGLSESIPAVRKGQCIAHPVKKRHYVEKDEIIDYASDINILLAYYNLVDNWKDVKSPVSGTGALALKCHFKKIRKKYPEKCDIIENRLEELRKLEKDKCASMDKAAEPFAKLMEEITAYAPMCDSEKTMEILRWIGYNLGKWIYIIDAYDDLEDDIRKKAYNPLVLQFGYDGGDIAEFKEKIRKRVEFNLTFSLSQLSKAYDLLKLKHNSGIVENIIYLGMLRKTENILGTGSCRKVEESI